MFNLPQLRIRKFAKWATIKEKFIKEKHFIDHNNAIVYNVQPKEAYANHIEMSSLHTSAIVSYGCDANGNLRAMRHVIFPTLRKFPNKTHDSLDYNFKGISLKINDNLVVEKVDKFIFDGKLCIFSKVNDIIIKRTFVPSQNFKALIEVLEFCNTGKNTACIEIINNDNEVLTKPRYGHLRKVFKLGAEISNIKFKLFAGKSEASYISYYGLNMDEKVKIFYDDMQLRDKMLNNLKSLLNFNTPNTNINIMASFAKIRASESIFMTKSGLMHSPGGGGYYAALWTNDQCEYVNPLFAYLGYELGIMQSKNCYELYKKYISDDKALITSIISEGEKIWNGVNDRGDSAMYAYGLSRFLLSMGDKKLSQNFIAAIEKCLQFTMSKINENGVIESDSDELENRFESGNANLCTSCLTYDALISAAYLEKELENYKKENSYLTFAKKLKENIETYFGKNIEGYKTYMYCAEEKNLRSWISMPLVVGIFDRAEETKNALLSNKLLNGEGLVTRSGETTFWDRSTLYSLRGLFNAGFADEALELLSVYTKSRLLGEHIPYAVEAFPEGNQAQLSAESGLYIRILSEGIMGYRPTGFSKFVLNPQLPSSWNYFSVKNMQVCFDKVVDIDIIKENGDLKITITYDKNLIVAKANEEIKV